MAAVVYVALQQFCEHDPRPLQRLRAAGYEVRLNTLGRRLRREDMLGALQDAEAVIAGVEPYEAQLLHALPRLRCISRCGVGTDSIDMEAVRQRGIAVYTTPDEVVDSVAQMTVALIFALARQLPWHLAQSRAGQWKKRPGVLLSEWTIGVIGFGRIGRAVERSLRVFGPQMMVADPAVQPSDLPPKVRLRPLPEVLRESDLISLHASPLRHQGPLIGRKEFAQMKPGSVLINTSRGFLVDEAALDDALASGHVAGAALDVFAEEPYTGPLTRHPQVICTPHVASLTRAGRIAMEQRCVEHVLACLASPIAGQPAAPAAQYG